MDGAGPIRRAWRSRAGRAAAAAYLLVFLTAAAWALYTHMTWDRPDADLSAIIPLAVASPTASVLFAISQIAAESFPSLAVLTTTPFLIALMGASALLQALLLGVAVEWLASTRRRPGGSARTLPATRPPR